MSQFLTEIDWNCLVDMNVDEAWKYLMLHINHCIEHFVPMKTSVGAKAKPRWMDSHCIKAVKKNYHAWKQYTYSRSYLDYQHYCKL